MKNFLRKIFLGIMSTVIITPMVFIAPVYAATASLYSSYGDVSVVPGGNPGNALQLRSSGTASATSAVNFFPTPVGTFGNLNTLSADYEFTENTCISNTSRFVISADNGVNFYTFYIYIKRPDLFNNCPQNVWTSTGNLMTSSDAVFENPGFGYETLPEAKVHWADYNVSNIQFVTEGQFLFPDLVQTVLLDNVTINNDIFTFEANPTLKDCIKSFRTSLRQGTKPPFRDLQECIKTVVTNRLDNH